MGVEQKGTEQFSGLAAEEGHAGAPNAKTQRFARTAAWDAVEGWTKVVTSLRSRRACPCDGQVYCIREVWWGIS